MGKFWKEDFKYVGKFLSYGDICYTFSVSGESAVYLKYKYHLDTINIRLDVFMDKGCMSIVGKSKLGLDLHFANIDEEDYQELMNILQIETLK